jgi:hypothetical protein
MDRLSFRHVAVVITLVSVSGSACSGLATQEQADKKSEPSARAEIVDTVAEAPNTAAAATAAPNTTAASAEQVVAAVAPIEEQAEATPTEPPAATVVETVAEPVAQAPVAPTVLASNAVSTTTASIEWSMPTGTSVEVELVTSDGTVVNSFITAEARWEPAGLAEATEYRIRITAIDPASGLRSVTTEAGFRTQTPPPPPPPPVIQPAADIPAPSANVYYANCADARGAGAAPLYRGDPGYRSGLDRDNDGVACEK